jgi:hypothetical protein
MIEMWILKLNEYSAKYKRNKLKNIPFEKKKKTQMITK